MRKSHYSMLVFGVLALVVLISYQNCSGVRLLPSETNTTSETPPIETTTTTTVTTVTTTSSTTTTVTLPPTHPYRFLQPAAMTVFNAGESFTLTWVPPDQNITTHVPGCLTTQVQFLDQYFYNTQSGTTQGATPAALIPAEIPTGNYVAIYACNTSTGLVILDQRTFRIENATVPEGELEIIQMNFEDVFRRPFAHFSGTGFGTRIDWYADFSTTPPMMGYPLDSRILPNSTSVQMLSLRFTAPPITSEILVNHGYFSQNPDNGTTTMFFSETPGELTWSQNRIGCSVNGFNLQWKVDPNNPQFKCPLEPGRVYYLNISFINLASARQGAIVSTCLRLDVQPPPEVHRCRWWGAMGFF